MIGVLGGTFDPIHYGHLRPAHEVYRRLGLTRLHIVPSAVPPHRDSPAATPEQRLRMVELAVAEFPGLIADGREVQRGGVSYTVLTLESMRAEIGSVPLCFILGTDAFVGLPSWHRWEELFELAHFIVVQRPGVATAPVPPWAAKRVRTQVKDIVAHPAGGIVFIPVVQQDISATALRAAIREGKRPSIDSLPPVVWEYIRSYNIYSE